MEKNKEGSTWVTWQPPPPLTIKINFDGAKNSHGAGIGLIAREGEGFPIMVREKDSNISKNVAEHLSVDQAIKNIVRMLKRRLSVGFSYCCGSHHGSKENSLEPIFNS